MYVLLENLAHLVCVSFTLDLYSEKQRCCLSVSLLTVMKYDTDVKGFVLHLNRKWGGCVCLPLPIKGRRGSTRAFVKLTRDRQTPAQGPPLYHSHLSTPTKRGADQAAQRRGDLERRKEEVNRDDLDIREGLRRGGGVDLARRGGVVGLPGRAAADGVPHCEGRRLASRGGGEGRMGGWGTGIGGALLPKCQQASGGREMEREAEVRGFGGRRADGRLAGRSPQTLRLELKRGLGAGFRC
ncbi:hypothetical protein F7725_003107 [Dissostichus mawsoni]|uniref:Uncharacterized protein n=1 Tax=Dissostichus mawsoni TaxID=36200 RepID=A0A7J5YB78_DISMA|nr:hypothetical protein F7725_003107 [Dissostichus mawsoni]